MNEVMENIIKRRSIRSFEERQILPEEIGLILKAAVYAPSGSNQQKCRFTVIQNKEKLDELNTILKEGFLAMDIPENAYPALKAAKVKASDPNQNYLYHAPTLIIITNEKNNRNAMADSAMAQQNIFLAAQSIGIGSCYINQPTWLAEDRKVNEFLRDLGVPEGHAVCCSAAVGYPKGAIPEAPKRRGDAVAFVK